MNLALTTPIPLSLEALTIALGPLPLLLFALVPSKWTHQHLGKTIFLTNTLTLNALLWASLTTIKYFTLSLTGQTVQNPTLGNIDLLLDAFSLPILLLVSFLGVIITRFSTNYLAGDPRQGTFLKWLCITLGSVQILSLAGNLLLFTIAWIMTSLSLHQLLTFYADRPAARTAARKKFFISRLGDACLLAALFVTWNTFGTWNFSELFSAIATHAAAHGAPAIEVEYLALLLVCSALLKSAQFPFHTWLPDTMETPTPVSALMHAGIINAGGFLVIRLSPIILASTTAPIVLIAIGSLTALFGSITMLTQPSIKRSLAYSTIAQMGFMMLQCGLGAIPAALLHLIAHSLYKAHAFLSIGTLKKHPTSPNARTASAPHPIALFFLLTILSTLAWSITHTTGLRSSNQHGQPLLGLVLLMALATWLSTLWKKTPATTSLIGSALIGGFTLLLAVGLHAVFETILTMNPPAHQPPVTSTPYGITTAIAIAFFLVFALQATLPKWANTPWGQKCYVHASHGLYLGLLLNQHFHSRKQQAPSQEHASQPLTIYHTHANQDNTSHQLLSEPKHT